MLPKHRVTYVHREMVSNVVGQVAVWIMPDAHKNYTMLFS
jgi:hypothetical protein